MSGFDLAQTFFVDKQAVKDSDSVYFTSVDLYFKSKPVSGKTSSGISEPGVSLYVCAVNDRGMPDLSNVSTSNFARVEFGSINTSSTGATATTFTFNSPMYARTNRSYALLITFDGSDPAFELWINKADRAVVSGSNRTQVSSGKVDGSFYRITNGVSLTPETDADLAFKLKIAKFSSSSATFKLVNRPAETLKLDTVTGTFTGGELVYQEATNATGTINVSTTSKAVIGTGTTFTTDVAVGDYIVITDGTTGNADIRQVVTRANSTYITVDATPTFSNTTTNYFKAAIGRVAAYNNMTDTIVLQDSTATSTLYFETNKDIKGVDSGATANVSSRVNLSINSLIPSFNINTPVETNITTEVNIAQYDSTGPTFTVSGGNLRKVNLGERLFLSTYSAGIAPRSTEVTAATPFKSFTANLTFTTTNDYASPCVKEEDLDVFMERYAINNSDTNEYAGVGNAQSRYVSKTINLSKDQLAEDLKVYVTAYKPDGTDIKVYARFRNSTDTESLEVKDWTELTLESDPQSSSPTNMNDLIEMAFTVPTFSTDATAASGTFTATAGLAYVTGTSGAVSTDIPSSSLIHMYSPTLPAVYFVDGVVSSNSTTFTIATGSSKFANASLVGTGFKVNKINRKNSAFLDIQVKNIITYFNTSMAKFQGYDSFAIKLVLLSSDGVRIPMVNDVRAVAVSA